MIYLRDFAPDKEAWVPLLMPVGILGEVDLGLSPVFVLLGAVAMMASVVLTGVLALKNWGDGRAAT